MSKVFSFTVTPDVTKRKEYIDFTKISRGVGAQRAKKGKGSYTRKEKYKNNYE